MFLFSFISFLLPPSSSSALFPSLAFLLRLLLPLRLPRLRLLSSLLPLAFPLLPQSSSALLLPRLLKENKSYEFNERAKKMIAMTSSFVMDMVILRLPAAASVGFFPAALIDAALSFSTSSGDSLSHLSKN